VTHWGMSEEVGVVFAGPDEAGASLNMSRVDPSFLLSSSQTLAIGASGRLVPNSQPNLARGYAFTMAVPAAPTSSPGMATLVDREIRKILDEGHALARTILQEHFDQLQLLADELMEHEQLNRAEFDALVKEEHSAPGKQLCK